MLLERQRVLLLMIRLAGGEVDPGRLKRWTYLLSERTPFRDRGRFYSFVVLQGQPVSFCLSRELGSLLRRGMVADRRGVLCLLADVDGKAFAVPGDVRQQVQAVIEGDGTSSAGGPTVVVHGQALPDAGKRASDDRPGALYTIGYRGLDVDELLGELLERSVRYLADVRNHPVSRRYGYCASTLRSLCAEVGIEYEPCPEVGVPSCLRQGLSRDGMADVLRVYPRRIGEEQPVALSNLIAMVTGHATALLCAEADPSCCHRAPLADVLSRSTGLEVVHLRWPR